jgi:hypothetical protein
MRILFLTLLCVFVETSALYAETVFPDHALTDISVVSGDPDNGVAVIKDQYGSEASVAVGDQVGLEGWTVTEIGELYVEVQSGDTITRIKVSSGYKRIQGP